MEFHVAGSGQRKIQQRRFNGSQPGESDDVLNNFWQGDQFSSTFIFLQNISKVGSLGCVELITF